MTKGIMIQGHWYRMVYVQRELPFNNRRDCNWNNRASLL